MSTKEREEAMNEYGLIQGCSTAPTRNIHRVQHRFQSIRAAHSDMTARKTWRKFLTIKKMGFSYTRINNPTVESFEKRVTMLEDGIGSVACASGMAALTNAFLNILQAGDEIVAACGLYGGTVELFDDLKPFGIL